MPLNITVQQSKIAKPKISVFGVGGAGGNALNNMISSNLEGVEFIAANTDAQALQNSLSKNKIQLGINTTKGLGAGSFPDQGKLAAEENANEINKYLDGNNMVFITAGMGGGTGTGAAPVIAKLAKEQGILTVGVVTKPFDFEGKYRMNIALKGIEELRKFVDTLIIIPNQNLFRIANETTTFEAAFQMADNVLHAGVRGVTDLITMPGLVNLDFADIKTIMTKMGKAMMGTGEAEGENRAINACREAISNPLLDDISIKGAKGVLVNMTGGSDMTLFEADQAVNEIRDQVDENANIIFGSAFNENMKGKIRVSVVATGIGDQYITENSKQIEERASSISESETDFFNPKDIRPIDNDLKEISARDFKPKINLESFIHDDKEIKINEDQKTQTLQNSATNKKDVEKTFNSTPFFNTKPSFEDKNNSDFFDNKSVFDTISSNNFTPQEEEKLEIKDAFNSDFYQKTLPIEKEQKKNETGFSLFNFMKGGKKNKASKNDDLNYNKDHAEDRARQEVLDFSFHDNELEELTQETNNKNHLDSEDDILDIPTFFRKKRS